jgi:large subunit ribosomal protein L10
MRPEKNFIIDEIKSRVDQTPYVLLTDYTGMQVPQFNELRNRLSGAKAEMRVVKNTLLRRALKDSNLPDLESYLHGQSAVIMGESDISAAAKVLKNFAAEFQKPKIKVGILDKAVLEPAQILALADLPTKDVLQSQLLGLLLQPATMLARLINTPASMVAQVLKAYADKGEPINGAPAAKEEPKAEAAAEAPKAEVAAEAPKAEAAPEAPKAEAAAEAPKAEVAPQAEAAPVAEAAPATPTTEGTPTA